jgi:subtilisin family serine protease
MAMFYGRKRERIALELSRDDVLVRFAGEAGRAAARKAAAGLSARAAAPGAAVRQFGRYLLLHDAGAAEAPVAAAVSALPKALGRQVARTYPVYVEQSSGLRLAAGHEITVRFRPHVTAARRNRLLSGLDLAVVRENAFVPGQVVASPAALRSGSRVVDLANALVEADDLVEFAAPNFFAEYRKYGAGADPLLSRQWHLDNPGGDGAKAGEDVRAFAAWEITPGGDPSVVIAIIDDGVDTRHPDLKANLWRNPDRDAPDRLGRNFADDEHPYDPNPRFFQPPYDDTDGNDIHGTPCAGVAAAARNNKGVAGIAYRCRILPVKIFAGPSLAPNDRIADAIRYAGRHASILSCSWGIPRNPDVESAIEEVVSGGRNGRGCLVFCAAGNEQRGRISFPAALGNTLAVGASNDQGVKALYSNWGPELDFVAPSSDEDRGRPGITTTDVSRKNRGYNLKGAYATDFGGTSSATPLAAGVAALLLSVKPALSWRQARQILRDSADKIDRAHGRYDQRGFSTRYGWGRLNAQAALLRAGS